MSEPQVKVLFRLVPDEDGYPPFDTEGLWATPVAPGRYRLDNIPFFAAEVAFGDVVTAEPEERGLFVSGVVDHSGHSTFRVMTSDVSMNEGLRDRLTKWGCEVEIGNSPTFLAVDVPPKSDLVAIQAFLEQGTTDGSWDYEEACLAAAESSNGGSTLETNQPPR